MNDLKTLWEPPLGGVRGDEPVDHLLREYFQSEMPDPWPAPPSRRDKAQLAPAPSRWTMSTHRWALAAAIALFALGYGALAYFFPDSPMVPDNSMRQKSANVPGPAILDGDNPQIDRDDPLGQITPQRIRTPRGRPARLREHVGENKIIIEVQGDPMLFPRP